MCPTNGVPDFVGNFFYTVRNLNRYMYPSTFERTIILPVVLYVCETWSLTLRDERRLRVFENRVLRRVFGPKRDEATRNQNHYAI